MTKPSETNAAAEPRTKYPAEHTKKGAADRERKSESDVGEDSSSGSETIESDPTRFPKKQN